ncbi:MAG: GDP-mannose 4,6-dehydratase [Chlamydiae bacterium]|nr:GDP-mannose 4,6-dehydratase [Chlamydiota bacterium]MBI3277106.1 GDP-mannose 4,6-dehydratase [Chlamydiota bacterium]
MKALITGGAGFIGSHLAEALLREGHHVDVMDDLSTGSIENIQHLKTHKNFHYVIDTIMNDSLLHEWMDHCDVVYHLAAAVGVRLIVESPVRTIDTNIRGTEKVLEAAHFIRSTQSSSKIEFFSYEEAYGEGFEDMQRRVPDISKIKKQIGFQPTTSLDEMIQKVIAYFQMKGAL